jgi:hypothetical protein
LDLQEVDRYKLGSLVFIVVVLIVIEMHLPSSLQFICCQILMAGGIALD